MPISDVNPNAEFARKPSNPDSGRMEPPHCPPPPQPVWFVPPPIPIPADYPHYNPYDPHHHHHHHDDDDGRDDKEKEDEEKALRASIEAQICKLSRRAAAIKIMIDNFKNKNKDAIIRIGGTSYNFGGYKKIIKDDEGHDVVVDSEYGEIILSILTNELRLIKDKIAELAGELEDEEDGLGNVDGTYTTVDRD